MTDVCQLDDVSAVHIGSETTARQGVEDPQSNLYSLPRPTCTMADRSWWTGWWWQSTWWNTSDRWQPPDDEEQDAHAHAAQAAWDHAPEPAQAEWNWEDEESSTSSDVPMQRREQWANSLWEGDVIGTVTAHEVKKMSNQQPQRTIDELPRPGEAAASAAPLTRLIIIGSNYGSIRKKSSVRHNTSQLLELPWHVHIALEIVTDDLLDHLDSQGMGGLQATAGAPAILWRKESFRMSDGHTSNIVIAGRHVAAVAIAALEPLRPQCKELTIGAVHWHHEAAKKRDVSREAMQQLTALLHRTKTQLLFIDGNQTAHADGATPSILSEFFTAPHMWLQPPLEASAPLWARSAQALTEHGACCGWLIHRSLLAGFSVMEHGEFSDLPGGWERWFRQRDVGWHLPTSIRLQVAGTSTGARRRSQAAMDRRKAKRQNRGAWGAGWSWSWSAHEAPGSVWTWSEDEEPTAQAEAAPASSSAHAEGQPPAASTDPPPAQPQDAPNPAHASKTVSWLDQSQPAQPQPPAHDQSVQQAATEVAQASNAQTSPSGTEAGRQTVAEPAAGTNTQNPSVPEDRTAALQRHSDSLQHLSAHYVDQKIQALYQRYNPKSFQELDRIFKKYDTDQLRTALLAALLRKYEPATTVQDLTAQAAAFTEDTLMLARRASDPAPEDRSETPAAQPAQSSRSGHGHREQLDSDPEPPVQYDPVDYKSSLADYQRHPTPSVYASHARMCVSYGICIGGGFVMLCCVLVKAVRSLVLRIRMYIVRSLTHRVCEKQSGSSIMPQPARRCKQQRWPRPWNPRAKLCLNASLQRSPLIHRDPYPLPTGQLWDAPRDGNCQWHAINRSLGRPAHQWATLKTQVLARWTPARLRTCGLTRAQSRTAYTALPHYRQKGAWGNKITLWMTAQRLRLSIDVYHGGYRYRIDPDAHTARQSAPQTHPHKRRVALQLKNKHYMAILNTVDDQPVIHEEPIVLGTSLQGGAGDAPDLPTRNPITPEGMEAQEERDDQPDPAEHVDQLQEQNEEEQMQSSASEPDSPPEPLDEGQDADEQGDDDVVYVAPRHDDTAFMVTVLRVRYPWANAFAQNPFGWRFWMQAGPASNLIRRIARILHVAQARICLLTMAGHAMRSAEHITEARILRLQILPNGRERSRSRTPPPSRWSTSKRRRRTCG